MRDARADHKRHDEHDGVTSSARREHCSDHKQGFKNVI